MLKLVRLVRECGLQPSTMALRGAEREETDPPVSDAFAAKEGGHLQVIE
jgi:hypothetical protein